MARPRQQVDWSPSAESDLSDIWDYYETAAGPLVADRIVNEIRKACLLLEEHPLAGRSREELRPGLRSLVAAPYTIFYRVRQGGAEIARVLHGRQDIGRIFADR
jgi:toxin ParE1/3/4